MFYFICYSSTNINVLSSIVVVTDPNHSPYIRMEIAEDVWWAERARFCSRMDGGPKPESRRVSPLAPTGVRTYPYHCFSCGLLEERTWLLRHALQIGYWVHTGGSEQTVTLICGASMRCPRSKIPFMISNKEAINFRPIPF